MTAALHTADLFLKTSSYIRYLLDDVLPAEVYGRQYVEDGIIETLIDECDALVNSLRNFKQQRTKVLPNKETVPSSSLINTINLSCYFKSEKNDNRKFMELCKAVREKVVSYNDLLKIKPHYCKICDVATLYAYMFNQHCASKKHVEQTNQILESVTIYKCKICLLLLISPKSEVKIITSFPGHSVLDEHIQNLKGFTDKIQSENIDQCKSSLVKVHHGEDGAEISYEGVKSDANESFYIPHKVNQLFQIMKKRLKSDTNLSEIVPHYCNVCDVMAYSVSKFIEHSSSKDHISAVNCAPNPIHVFKCEKCGFLITGYQIVIDSLVNSVDHQDLDEYVRTLKACKEPQRNIEENVPLLNGVETFSYNKVTVTESSKRNFSFIPEDLNIAISSLLEKLKLPSECKKLAPAYCYVCAKIFICNNDFKQHLTSRKHNVMTSAVKNNVMNLPGANSFYLHNCPTCLISLYGTDSDINRMINSIEHINLHKRIHYLFTSNSVLSNTDQKKSDQDILKQNSVLKSDFIPNKVVVSNISESKKSYKLNEILAGPNQNNTSSSPNINMDTKRNLPPVKRIDQGIPDKFLTLNSKLQCGNFSKCGFCRPCKKGINLTKGWATHLQCSRHKKAIEKMQFENIPLPCKYCPLQILGDQVVDSVCMDIHIKLNHPSKKSNENQNGNIPLSRKMEISELCTETMSEHSKSTERTDFNENSNHGGNDSALIIVKEDIYLPTEEDSRDETSLCSTKEFYNSQNSCDFLCQESSKDSLKSQDNCLEVFIRFLEKRKTVFLNEGLKQFGGLCLLCSLTFEDYFDWLVHLKDACHNVSRDDVIEKECSKCNLSLYGKNVIVENDFWSLKEHTSLDDLVTQ